MKLNRKWILVMALALSVAMATSGTLAYLTDRDSEANVFTLGNVDIDLEESFEQDSTLIPGVDIEKEPIITNTGKNAAWVWATIAIPSALDDSDASKNVIHFNFSPESVAEGQWTWKEAATNWDVPTVEHDGLDYNVYTVLYNTALQPGESTKTAPIYKVYMDAHIDIDPEGNLNHVEKGVVTKLNWNINDDAPMIFVSAYAMQTDNFATVEEAYAAYTKQWTSTNDAADAVIWAEADDWTDKPYTESQPATAEDLEKALADSNDKITLANDVALNAAVTVDPRAVIDLQLNDNTMTLPNLFVGGTVLMENGDVNTKDNGGYGIRTTASGHLELNKVDITTEGGGLNILGETVFGSGTVTINSKNTSPRHVFYVAGGAYDGHLLITGGEFFFNPSNLTRKGSYLCADGEGAVIEVFGGTFHKPSTRTAPIQALNGGIVKIYGGTFAFDPSGFVANGYEAVKGTDGYWTVSAK